MRPLTARAHRPAALPRPRARPGTLAVAGAAALALMAATQVASSRGGPPAAWTTAVVVLLVAASALFGADRRGGRRLAVALAAVVAFTVAAEWIGMTTGWPFGHYRYTGALQPTVGPVPLLVPLAWFGLGLPAYAVGACATRSRTLRLVVAAAAMTAWDLFLDPQLVSYGFWTWQQPGAWFGVPLVNFAGWFGVSLVVMVLFEATVGPRVAGPGLLAGYTVMAVMETVGFAAVFDFPLRGEGVIALAGGTAMGAAAAAGWLGTARRG